MSDTKLYVITTAREIPCLGGICGPVTTPVKLSHRDVIGLLKRGFEMYECNPIDSTERVLVTRSNINNITFSGNRAIVTAQRMLNRSIQDMDKPVMVDVVKRDNGKNSKSTKEEPKAEAVTTNTSSGNKDKQNETAQSTNENKTKVTAPDAFSK